MIRESYLILEDAVGYCFKNKKLLMNALTHSSYSSDKGMNYSENNERLEYLGDAFFDAIIGTRLYKLLPLEREGKLSKMRAKIVCEDSLEDIGKSLKLGDYLLIGKGEEQTGGRTRKSIIANAMEAIIGAIYLDSDYDTVYDVVNKLFDDKVSLAIEGKLLTDYKTKLQEIIQKKYKDKAPSYEVIKTEGPDHDKVFFMDLILDEEIIGKGLGKSKKEAEQNAAADALTRGVK
ncbi:MAG: ribonuclease III [Peptostreptococcaceae bacterium]|nr:ribonuclease III [Peptostreptococcaceae bacterium]